MNKNVSYKILPELKLIIEYFSGNIDIQDAIDLKRREVEDKYYNPGFSFIVSLSDIHIESPNQYDIRKLIELIKGNVKALGSRRSAILTATPKQVATTSLYTKAAKDLPINFRIVSSVQAALDWILIPNKYESIVIENIEKLKSHQAQTIKE